MKRKRTSNAERRTSNIESKRGRGNKTATRLRQGSRLRGTSARQADAAGVAPGVWLYTKEQVAARLQVSPRCVTDMMREGTISYLKMGKLVRFRASHVLRRLKETSYVCHTTVSAAELLKELGEASKERAGAEHRTSNVEP